jgi:CMP-N-acetylneuraminic acid synthetase
MNEILLYDTEHVKGDLYLQTHSTNPLLKAATISKAIREFTSQRDRYDSLFSVTRVQVRLWDRTPNRSITIRSPAANPGPAAHL